MTISYPFLDNIPSMQIHPIHIVAFVWMKEQQRIVPLVQHDLHGSETGSSTQLSKFSYLLGRKELTGRSLDVLDGCIIFHLLVWCVREDPNLRAAHHERAIVFVSCEEEECGQQIETEKNGKLSPHSQCAILGGFVFRHFVIG